MNINSLKGKKILVTGGAGSIGKALVSKLLKADAMVVRAYDNNEKGVYDLQSECGNSKQFRPLIGDVRDIERLSKAMKDIDMVFHAAALKHVELSEYNPFEVVKTNVIGTQNVLDCAIKKKVEKVVIISTDKAVNPVSLMGTSKLMSEKLTVAGIYHKGEGKTKFAVVRFGNVIGSNGSVIPKWVDQINSGGPVTITDKSMTRFMMSIDQAVDLVIQASDIMIQGEIFILKMPSLRMLDLAKVLIKESAKLNQTDRKKIKIKEIGVRPGEKLHEELLTEYEVANSYHTNSMYVVLPKNVIVDLEMEKMSYPYKKVRKLVQYRSDKGTLLNQKEIKKLLVKSGALS